MTALAQRIRLPDRLVLCAPFALPFVHDPRTVSAKGIATVRSGLLDAMDGQERPRWESSPVTRRRYNDFAAALAEQLRDASPQWILRRDPESVLTDVRAALPEHPVATGPCRPRWAGPSSA